MEVSTRYQILCESSIIAHNATWVSELDNIKNEYSLLLVEDESIIALAEKRDLESYGYTVHHAGDAESAIARAKNPDIDLVLMDIDLGSNSADGTTAAREILAERVIPIVFLSSHTERAIVEKTEAITSYGYVVKNSGITVLDASIKMAFRLFEAREREQHHKKRLQLQGAALESTTSPVVITDRHGAVEFVNEAWESLTGYSREEVLGGHYRLMETDLIDEDLYNRVWGIISSGTAWRGELTSRTKAGEQYHELTTITPITDGSGAITHYVAIKQDLSDKLQHEEELSRHNAELRATEEELRQSNEELRVVQDEMREYIETLVFANDELRLSENRFRNLVEAQSSYVIRTDIEGNYTYINRRFAEDFAHPQEKLIGNASMDSIIPEDHPKVFDVIQSLLKDPDTPLQIELRKPRSNGNIVSTLWSFSCITNSDNEPVEIQCVGFDISERAALERALQNKLHEKETLLKEVHHRIKNSIASIVQILQLQENYVSGSEAKQALRETANRIESMKYVYDMLLRSEKYEELSARAYILSLLESIQTFYDSDTRIAVSADIEDVRLGARTAFLLGIIVNELLTNAFKYAFPPERRASEADFIHISLTTEGSDSDKGSLHLVVRDNGIGSGSAARANDTQGLGSLLVHSLAEQQGGSAVMESENGTTWRVTIHV